jgi:dUTP pyrophosphatase
MVGNGIGVIDEDYCGDGDEYQALLYNFTTEAVSLAKGDRIVQAIVLPVHQFAFKEVDSMGTPDRGGFGSTQ